jgi:hypothetical protein
MRKLSLRMDDLAVESFHTGAPAGRQGTVRSHGDSTGCSYGSPDFTLCDATCNVPCAESGECTPACPWNTVQCNPTPGCPGTALSCDPDTMCDDSCPCG